MEPLRLGWVETARTEIFNALKTDYSMPDLLLKMSLLDLALGRNDEAQFYYEQFRLADPASPIIQNTKFTASP